MSCFLHSLAPKVWLQPVEFLSSTASHLVWCHGQKAKKPFVKLALKEHKRTRSKEGTGVNASWLRFVEEDFWCKGCSVYAPTRALSNPSSSGTGLLQRFHQSDITTLSFSFLHCQHCTRFFNALCEPNAIFIALVTVFKVASKWEDIHTYIYINICINMAYQNHLSTCLLQHVLESCFRGRLPLHLWHGQLSTDPKCSGFASLEAQEEVQQMFVGRIRVGWDYSGN